MSDRRRVRRAEVGHNDDWLLTYADTITLLLCLFVVLLALQARTRGIAPDPPPAVAVEERAVPVDFLDWKPPFQRMTTRTEAQDDAAIGAAGQRTTQEDDPFLPTAKAGDPLSRESAGVAVAAGGAVSLPEIVAQLQPEGAARLEQVGDRITTLAFDSTAFFGRGSAVLSGSGKVILQEVVGNLKSAEYRDYMVTIEGHTDDALINTPQFPSNWELSTARAAAVVRFCVEQGVAAARLRAAGYADTHPLQPNRDGNGMAMPENQARNRRVVIVMEKIERR
jgi:chemotaxis protein MotB